MELSEKTFSTQGNFHLAGIVPIAGLSLDFQMPYPDCLMPIAPDYTMIEAAIIECAFAGCDTIWVICNDDTAPLVRYRVGDFIQDPIYFYNNLGPNPKGLRRRIPIYWVPIHPKDRDKRDCLSWSVLHGSLSCLKICSSLSKWMIPDKYYVSFPYGLFDPRPLQKQRLEIRKNKNFYVSSDGKTVQDNYFSSFTFGKEEFIKYRKNVRKGTGRYSSAGTEDGSMPREELPLEERWSARFFELKDVFTNLDIEESTIYEPAEFYNLGNWDSYRQYINSNLAESISRPTRNLFSYREFNSIAKDREENT